MEEADGAKPMERACDICTEAGQLATLHCGCHWCGPCLKQAFTMAMTDETAYPPRCCEGPVRLRQARDYLPSSLVRAYRAKLPELSAKNKIYCHKSACSTFIASHSIHNGEAICQKCQARTCANCLCEAHFGPCSSRCRGEFDEELDRLAEDKGWQKCPDCGRLIEKIDGCNHIECRCGCEFCYYCGSDLDICSCHLEDNNDEDEAEGIEELERRQIRIHQAAAAVVDMNRSIEAHIEEEHVVRRDDVLRINDAGFVCCLCDREFRTWILMCPRCGIFVCNGCRLARQQESSG